MVAHTSLSTYGMCLSMCSWIHPVTHSVQLGNATTFGRGFEMRASIFLLLCHLAFHPPTSKQAASFLLSVYCSSPRRSTLQLQASCFLPFFSLSLHPPPFRTAHYHVTQQNTAAARSIQVSSSLGHSVCASN